MSDCSDLFTIIREPLVDGWQVSQVQPLQVLLVKRLGVVARLRVELVDLWQRQVELVEASLFVEPDGLLGQLTSLSWLGAHCALLLRDLAWNLHLLKESLQVSLR